MDNLCPIDGRYRRITREVRDNGFTEEQLIITKGQIELRWLLHLIPILKKNTQLIKSDQEEVDGAKCLKEILTALSSDPDARSSFVTRVSDIERLTLHDTKAVELAIRELLERSNSPKFLREMSHIGLTSEDVTGSSYALMFYRTQVHGMSSVQSSLVKALLALAKITKSNPMLSMTHGQPASPTTFGKEICVFLYRLKMVEFGNLFSGSIDANLVEHTFPQPRIKFGGAVGTHGAILAAFPNIDWLTEIDRFIHSLTEDIETPANTSAGTKKVFELDLCTTQIPNREWMLMRLRSMELQNNVLMDLCRDLWLYISRGILVLRVGSPSEVGSSAMPHKINPIDFENAEGNLTLANGLINVMCTKLSQSRAQRDLSDSTVIRNLGLCFSYSLIAYKSLLKGLDKISFDANTAASEFAAHPEIVAEPIQTILRKYPDEIHDPYEKLKTLTRGVSHDMSSDEILRQISLYVESLATILNPVDYEYIQSCLIQDPASYIGLSEKIADRVIASWEQYNT